MSVLIAYASKYGFSKMCTELLKETFDEKVDIFDLKQNWPDLNKYDKVIVGGSVYMGKVRRPVTQFCSANVQTLKHKKLGLFVCGLAEGDEAKKQLEAAFPKELLQAAFAKASFGGGCDFKKMNFMEHMIIQKVTGSDTDYVRIDRESLEHFAEIMKNA